MTEKIDQDRQIDNYYVNLDAKGRLVLPVKLRKKADFKTGDIFAISLDQNSVVHASNVRKQIRALRGILKSSNKRDIVDELLAERRKEALDE